jgi:hypothetical protein
MLVGLYAMGAWLIDGPHHISPPKTGPAAPDYMKIGIRTFEIGGIVGSPLVIWFGLIRPWRRAGEITATGLAVIAYASLYWQDPLENFYNTAFVLNSHTINLNSWGPYIPGWRPPNGEHLVEAPVFNLLYIWAVFLAAILGIRAMAWAQRRWPDWTKLRLFAWTCFAYIVFDTVVEIAWLRIGINSYPGGWSWFTLFHGHYYQVPIMEVILAGIFCWGSWTSILYFRDDRGRLFPEKGIDQLRVGRRTRTSLRILSVIGAAQLAFFLYGVTFAMTQGLYADPWPKDVVNRPYFVNGLCGPGTKYPCPQYRQQNQWLVKPLFKTNQYVAPGKTGS